ncbi:hypothetical protein llh_6100 [Lactococcus cremoris subsp. cremoris A76]|nr:hypothetical protein llh_6100 [Lactococcus cremoris subsp. cremoris A76]KZK50503.1 hypothetical protein SK110_0056 [Lactococcus cremoris]
MKFYFPFLLSEEFAPIDKQIIYIIPKFAQKVSFSHRLEDFRAHF